MPRIAPLEPPYPAEVEGALRKWMPPGVPREPLALFRVLQVHAELASRLRVLGAGLLFHGTLPAADRELVIARVCALAGCGYEWGVHAAVFADQAGLSPEQLRATVTADAEDALWSPWQRTLLIAAGELHDTAHLTQGTWDALARSYDDRQLIEFLGLAGWYRTISYLANGLLLEHEPWAIPPPFDGGPGTGTADSGEE